MSSQTESLSRRLRYLNLFPIIRPLLFRLDPEHAHDLSLKALSLATRFRFSAGIVEPSQVLPTRAMGLSFPNPLGLAAGLDKNGDYIDVLSALGFGFLEVGTVTPRAQPGNPKPRLFRIPEAQAIINRMGFNNLGVDHLVKRLQECRYFGILGVNIGKNFDTPIEEAQRDYVICMRKVYFRADYLTINVSSPNTRNLRSLQQRDLLGNLLASLQKERTELSRIHGKCVPIAVKIAPDLDDENIVELAELFLDIGIDALIATNTTVARDRIVGFAFANEKGGLSGRPLYRRSTEVLAKFAKAFRNRIPIIASGGVMEPRDALAKLDAGATLVQLYSGLVYSGPNLIAKTLAAIQSTQ